LGTKGKVNKTDPTKKGNNAKLNRSFDKRGARKEKLN